MLKTIAAIRRRAGMSQAEFFRYYHDVHGGLAKLEPLDVARYVQNHVVDGVYGATGDVAILTGSARDAVTELSFRDPAAMQASFAAPYVRDVIGPDGVNFSDMPTAISLVAREEGAGPPTTAGLAKTMWFLKARDGVATDLFDIAWRDADERHAHQADLAGTRRSHRVRFPDGQDPARYFGGPDSIRYDGVFSLWWNSDDPVAAMHAYVAAFTGHLGGMIDASRSFWVVTREIEIFAQPASPVSP